MSGAGLSIAALPTVHLNGTSRAQLIELRCEAAQAIREALAKLAEVAPHARDYPDDPDARRYRVAVTFHQMRTAALEGVAADLMREAEALA